MKEEKKTDDYQLNVVLYLGGAFFLYKLWEKIEPKLIRFLYLHKYQFVIIGTVLTVIGITLLAAHLWNAWLAWSYQRAITAPDPTAVCLGRDENGTLQYLKQRFRTMHGQLISTTDGGKTESVVIPWLLSDIENGFGALIVDGKSDHSFRDKIYAHACRANRKDDFLFFSLADIERSATFNPLYGGSAREVVERVFSSFECDSPHYKNIQLEVFHQIVQLIQERNVVPTFALVQQLLTDMALLKAWAKDCPDAALKSRLEAFSELPARERAENTSGLNAHLSRFSSGDTSVLFNAENPHIQFDEILRSGKICYFQLPTMYSPFLAAATGKLALQAFQSAVAKRHLGLAGERKFFSCYLDDFQDYIYEGFGALLNKARSANIGVLFSHQALGDLDRVSPAFKNIVLTNTNIKIVMRNTDPDTIEYFARSFGTRQSEKVTERQKKNALGDSRTGEGSVRQVEEFIHHPNKFRQLGTGEGIVTVPHPKGVKILHIRFNRREDLPAIEMPIIAKEKPKLEPTPSQNTKTDMVGAEKKKG